MDFSMSPVYLLALFLCPLVFAEVKFDHFVYAQQWPPGMCMGPIEGANEECVIPKNVSSWTIHGLWPSLRNTETPDNCNGSWHFNETDIKSIMDQMWLHWPSLVPSKDIYAFWKHEWSKHGTCAASKPDLNSQLKYFAKGLMLQKTIAMNTALKDKNIVPHDNKTYLVADVLEAFENLFVKDSVIMECAYTRTPQYQYIKAVSVCIDRNSYKPIPCPTNNNGSTPEAPIGRDKCKGQPEFCSCTDTLVYPEFKTYQKQRVPEWHIVP